MQVHSTRYQREQRQTTTRQHKKEAIGKRPKHKREKHTLTAAMFARVIEVSTGLLRYTLGLTLQAMKNIPGCKPKTIPCGPRTQPGTSAKPGQEKIGRTDLAQVRLRSRSSCRKPCSSTPVMQPPAQAMASPIALPGHLQRPRNKPIPPRTPSPVKPNQLVPQPAPKFVLRPNATAQAETQHAPKHQNRPRPPKEEPQRRTEQPATPSGIRKVQTDWLQHMVRKHLT